MSVSISPPGPGRVVGLRVRLLMRTTPRWRGNVLLSDGTARLGSERVYPLYVTPEAPHNLRNNNNNNHPILHMDCNA